MEEVLSVYTRPFDARGPLICMDEGSKSLQANTHEPLPMQAGPVERQDDE